MVARVNRKSCCGMLTVNVQILVEIWTGSIVCVTKFKVLLFCCREEPGAILFPGRWSQEGCETNFNSTMTVCECNHLTHFAILLSARPLELSKAKILSLQIIGYVGVSISLVAMAATVFVFLFLKYVLNLLSKSKHRM
jgi:hypothetical protein